MAESRELDVSPERARLVVADALFTATGQSVLDRETAPRVELRRPLSVFDRCEVSASVEPLGGDRARVDASVAFDISEKRIDAVLMLTTSVVGIPFGIAWRGASIRGARRDAAATFAALWKAMADLTGSAAYR